MSELKNPLKFSDLTVENNGLVSPMIRDATIYVSDVKSTELDELANYRKAYLTEKEQAPELEELAYLIAKFKAIPLHTLLRYWTISSGLKINFILTAVQMVLFTMLSECPDPATMRGFFGVMPVWSNAENTAMTKAFVHSFHIVDE